MSNQSHPTIPYTPPPRSWPYTVSDFRRQDSSPDSNFYSSPRFVNHIDDAAITSLKTYYASTLPHTGRILDFCSSWTSHFPPSITSAILAKKDLEVVGMGMNAAELDANLCLTGGRILRDLNSEPKIGEEVLGGTGRKELDAAMCVVSIDYLTQPVEVLGSLRERMKVGGRVHLIISNRCFPTKVVGRWLRVGERERLEMVGDYLIFGGWKDVEIVTLSDGRGRDPLWVVRGTKEE